MLSSSYHLDFSINSRENLLAFLFSLSYLFMHLFIKRYTVPDVLGELCNENCDQNAGYAELNMPMNKFLQTQLTLVN